MSTPAGLADMAPLKRSIHRRKARNVASSPAVSAAPRSGPRASRVVPFPKPENTESTEVLTSTPAPPAEPIALLENSPPSEHVAELPPSASAPVEKAAMPSERLAAEPTPSIPIETPSSNNMAKELTAEPSYSTANRPATADRPGASSGSAAPAPVAAAPAPVSPRSLLKEAEEKLSLLRDNREIFEWILEKQSSLRTEFVGFLKKDLREIDYVVSDITTQGDKADFAANALELIKNTYIRHWEKSFELISPENVLQKTREE